ncbi:tyrosyl-tRNA synthetase [Acidimicrobium ferrooxidans DSM 10331]|uniref:Tyrosine--tRNA ligase n=1 Tax=Acidimicrobium ferrooxidans (strain DSM 10331 / JCM 15462 / NBRC 103882 / ICP) TaxID=525909 RepID=C7M0N3_ACIFD|nr:tyrosine--tRNA ligase [Acidimicrobium ferrooxidans]ACU54541.1 tyrosyl-tRNA synthetase [Acidimicrobium ferrooxidans DSM 10331]
MSLAEELRWRGAVQDASAPLEQLLDAGPRVFYIGFDPTADSLHVGNLLGIVLARRLIDAGHRAILVAGGATGMIGDPSGRSSERVLLDPATLRHNTARIAGQLQRLLGDVVPGAVTLEDNRTWLEPLTLIGFLRDIGKHVPVSAMLARESIRTRLGGEGLSFTEFSYMILQAVDFVELHRRYGCTLQLGGSDQWGNIAAGIDLVRRLDGHEVHGLTWPLVTKADGTKFGKSMGGNVWLDEDRTSPYELYQFFVRAEDQKVMEYVALYTFLSFDEIAALRTAHEDDPSRRIAHRRLAWEVVRFVHGEAAADQAAEAARALFEGGRAEAGAPVVTLERAAFGDGIDVIDLALAAGLARSRSEARRLIAQGGLYVDGRRALEGQRVSQADLTDGHLTLRRGKRDWVVVRLNDAN